eukprot:TRINITY_DN26141_c0_g1_i1.p1 TRINITY_DN26141_c0_g1~~TRINITY_DN26141_c0_g1_i1.p1  ORF type:complete len:271 (+),score=24.98 TRINITY_DN26141_c0_g1_i1:47-859(+)
MFLSTLCSDFRVFSQGFFSPCFIYLLVYGVQGIIFTVYSCILVFTSRKQAPSSSHITPSTLVTFTSTFISGILPLLSTLLLITRLDSNLFILFNSSQTLLLSLLPFLYYYLSTPNHLPLFFTFALRFASSQLFIIGFEIQLLQSSYSSSSSSLVLFLTYLKLLLLFLWAIILLLSSQHQSNPSTLVHVPPPSQISIFSPENPYSLYDWLTFFWANPLMKYGHYINECQQQHKNLNDAENLNNVSPSRAIHEDDLWEFPQGDGVAENSEQF